MSFSKLLSILLSCLLLTSCGTKDAEVFVVGTSADNPPYEFSSEGKVIGFDIDFAEALAARIGKKIEIKNMDFNGLVPALASGHLDAIISGISVTEERKEKLDFSNTYSESRIAVISKKISAIESIDTLKDKRVGAQLGTTWEAIIKKLLANVESVSYMTMTNNLALVEELKNDRIHAVVLEKKQAEKFLEQYPEFGMFLVDEAHVSNFAVALQKNSKYLEVVNKAIQELKSEGVIESLQSKWLK
jgi:ABC-type amino acid transport substrate-binding protein